MVDILRMRAGKYFRAYAGKYFRYFRAEALVKADQNDLRPLVMK